jgi:hypothetical protein
VSKQAPRKEEDFALVLDQILVGYIEPVVGPEESEEVPVVVDPQMSIVLLVDDPIMDERIPGIGHHAADIDSIGTELVAQAAKRAFHDEIQHLLVALSVQDRPGDITG